MQDIRAKLDNLVTNPKLNGFFETVDDYQKKGLVEIDEGQIFAYNNLRDEFINGKAIQDHTFGDRLKTFYKSHIKVMGIEAIKQHPSLPTYTNLVLEAEKAYHTHNYKKALLLYKEIAEITDSETLKERIATCQDYETGKKTLPTAPEILMAENKKAFEVCYQAITQAESLFYVGKFTEALPAFKQAYTETTRLGFNAEPIQKRIADTQKAIEQKDTKKITKEAYDKRAEMMWDRWTMGMYIFRAILISLFMLYLSSHIKIEEYNANLYTNYINKNESIVKCITFFILALSIYRLILSFTHPLESITDYQAIKFEGELGPAPLIFFPVTLFGYYLATSFL